MSNSKLLKSIELLSSSSKPDSLTWKPVVLADSKGKYIESSVQRSSKPENLILWVCKAGWKSSDVAKWIEQNLETLLKTHQFISLYVWIGTCDLTVKGKKYIQLRRNSTEALEQNLQKIKNLITNSNVKLTFFHIPYYSIRLWNETKGHENPSSYKESDDQLTSLIDTANGFIDKLNLEQNTSSPKFNEDLRRSRKSKGRKARYSTNYSLLLDGIHPKKTLATLWLLSMKKKIFKDCA